MRRLLDRPTGDLLVILIAATICGSVALGGGAIAVIEILHPESDTTAALGMISDVINTLIGLLAGVLIGRTDVTQMRDELRRDLDAAQAGAKLDAMENEGRKGEQQP
jgi:hypothetical protein